jgi:hypothetical protein
MNVDVAPIAHLPLAQMDINVSFAPPATMKTKKKAPAKKAGRPKKAAAASKPVPAKASVEIAKPNLAEVKSTHSYGTRRASRGRK